MKSFIRVFFHLSFVLFGQFVISSCGPTKAVMPLCYKENKVSASLGGPFINYNDKPIPVPFTSISYARGISDSLTLFASWYPTPALYGNLQMEIGINRYIVNDDSLKYAVTLAPSVHWLRKDSINKFYPQVDINYIKRSPLNDNYFYAGLSNWFEPTVKKFDGSAQKNIWFPSPQIGYVWNTKKGFGFQAEMKYLVPFKRNDYGPVEYINPFVRYGGFGLYFGFSYTFNRFE